MGNQGSSSKSKYESILESVTDVIVKNINQCATQIRTDQNIVIVANNSEFGNLKNRAIVQISGNCFQDMKAVTKLQNDVAQTIEQSAEAQSITLTGVLGSSQSDVKTKLYNKIRNDFKQETINQIINSINAKQNTIIVGAGLKVDNVENTIDQQVVSNATQSVVNNLDFMLKLKSDAQTSAVATQKDFVAGVLDSFFDGIFKSVAGPLILLFFFIMIVVVVYLYFSGDGQTNIGDIIKAAKA